MTSCPTPRKAAHRNRRNALRSLARQRSYAGVLHSTPPTYVYRCVCGAWHLTSDTRGPSPDQQRKGHAA